MDAPQDTETIDDLSALAWVQDELRRSLEAAHKTLRRFLKESEASAGSDVDAIDPGVLRSARAQLHQGVGALELVGLPSAAQMLRASEAALHRLSGRKVKLDLAAVETIERASFALLDYLARMLAAKPVSPVALFAQYRAVQELAGADRIHPADLWPHDWQWRDVPGDGSAARLADAALRSEVEAQTLAQMRQGGSAPAAILSDLFAGLAAGSPRNGHDHRLATLWQMAGAFFEAQAQGLLRPDVYSKRIASRLLAQLRMSEKSDAANRADVSERLAQDLLFFCAQADSPGDGRRAPRLAAVRQAWGLARRAPVDYLATQLGRYDPAWIVQAKKRVTAAKESWSAVAGGEMHRLATLGEQFHLVGDSLKRLYPSGEKLAAALAAAAAQTVASDSGPAAGLAMEVATSVLYLEASLDDAEFDHPRQAERVQRLAQRIDHARSGGAPEPLEAWMEELYRRVSDRQTMGSVVQELRSSLTESEKAIDQYFRDPTQRDLLIPVPGQLQAMRGVLSVLGLDQASQAVLRMRDDVDALTLQSDPAAAAAGGAFERLAANLGALGFLIDMLSVQPSMAKSLFAFDPASGNLRSVVGGGSRRASEFSALDASATPTPIEPRLIEQAQALAMAAAHPEVPLAEVSRDIERLSHEAMVADQPVLAETMQHVRSAFDQASTDGERRAVRDELAQAMADFVHSSSQALLDEAAAPARAQRAGGSAPTPSGQTGLEDDSEMREVFLEEAREVIQGAEVALAALATHPDDLGEMTTVRRAFHTLKGSSRMVGLKAFGEAAWACEQLYNTRLADGQPADHDLLALTTDVLSYLGDWVDAIGAQRDGGHASGDIQGAVDAFGIHGQYQPLPLPGTPMVLFEHGKAVEAPPPRRVTMPTMDAAGPLPLIDLVPDLPSARDLDLVPAAATSSIQSLDDLLASSDEVMPFELDLGEAANLPAIGREALQAIGVPDVEIDPETQPDAVSEMMALDLGDLVTREGPLDDFSLGGYAMAQDEPAVAPAPDLTPSTEPEPEPEVAAEAQAEAEAASEAETYKMVGPLRVSIPLFNIYLNEADEQSRRLGTELAEWALELHRPVGETAIALAHSLAGNSATVGLADLSLLARLLEHALMRAHALGRGSPAQAELFTDTADEIRRLLHQFAAGFLHPAPPQLVDRLQDEERESGERLESRSLMPDGADSRAAPLDEPVAQDPAEPLPEPVAEVEPVPETVAASVADVAAEPEPEPEPEPVPEPEPEPASMAAVPPVPFGDLGRAAFRPLVALTPLAPLAEARSVAAAGPDAFDDDDDIDAVDAADADLFPFFEEEALELVPQLASRMRAWAAHPGDPAGAAACMRTLHTLKGGARLAGAMHLGEMAHRLETRVDHLQARGDARTDEIEALLARVDAISNSFEALRAGAGAPLAGAAQAQPATAPGIAVPPPPSQPPSYDAPAVLSGHAAAEPAAPLTLLPGVASIDWRRFTTDAPQPAAPLAIDHQRVAQAGGAGHGVVRVRAPLLDRLVNHAGEVSITRARIESEVAQLKGSLADLSENLERLRSQLREVEVQAEAQVGSRLEAAKAVGQNFDPLEMDRYTRLQELTRMMAESVNDVATVQRSLQRTVQSAEDDLAAQARLTRDLQDDLLRTRMVEFEGLSDRLYRVVRQAAKETHKQVRLDLEGGSIEVDRGVLDRMGGAFEHLLRNCVTHGIEVPAERVAAGKDATGQITLRVGQEGNEVSVEIRDDGAGLDLARIRARAVAMGLLAADAPTDDASLAQLIFTPGFSTVESVTELAGRGVGMDVVRNDTVALGGRIETASAAGQGTSFRLVLPLTTAVTQVVMLRAGTVTVAVPSTLVEIVRRVPVAEIDAAYASGALAVGEQALPFFWLGALLQASGRGTEGGRNQPVVVIRSAQQRVALHVDEVIGNQEVVVKNLGAQLARLPGLAGVTLLASGAPALIYNPVALATLYGDAARTAMATATRRFAADLARVEPHAPRAPLILVVDDSLTVRRVTQRLLVREGYRVALAKDGLDALERLAEEVPTVVLSDIEMPRMDGFDLVRNLRADARLRGLPVIMITSRIAQKHRDHAAELGVNHYLGKPYSEEDLLALVTHYAAAAAASAAP